MNTATQKSGQLVKFDFNSVLVTYRAKNGSWRGFVAPYNITTEAETKEQAQTALQEMVEVYEEGLKKYDYPEHLTVVTLSDDEDKDVFNHLAVKALVNQGKIESPTCHAETRTISR